MPRIFSLSLKSELLKLQDIRYFSRQAEGFFFGFLTKTVMPVCQFLSLHFIGFYELFGLQTVNELRLTTLIKGVRLD